MIRGILHSEIFMLTLTIGIYLGAQYLYRRTHWALFNPLLVSMAVIIVVLRLLGIGYEEYSSGNEIINFMLGMSVVALGYLLYEQIENIRGNALSILTSVLAGSIAGVVSVALIARWLGAGDALVASLEPKSVTTPIAISVSASSGGIPALTSVAVIVAGVFGGMVGPWVLRMAGVRDRVAQGLAMGAASHALGTARAMEIGAIEGAIGGLAIGLMGVMTALLIPLLDKLM